MKVTDYERVAEVTPDERGDFSCPKCEGNCHERGPKRSLPKKARHRREWDCYKCARGWLEVPGWVETVADARRIDEEDKR